MLRRFGYRLADAREHRRPCSAALLVIYVVSAAGVPLPSGSRPKHSDELYPCANSACGCTSAEHCWRSCCCRTLAERFAWARDHQVRPPAFALAAARQTGIDLAWLDTSGNKPACCQSHAQCCQSKNTQQRCCALPHPDNRQNNNADQIVAWRMLKCHGQSLNWLAAVPTHIVARPTTSHDTFLTAWLGPAISEMAECAASQPSVPPPERA